MDPIVINSQLDFKQYHKIHRVILWKRLRWIVVVSAVLLVICILLTPAHERANSIYTWVGVWFFLYLFIIYLLQYFKTRSNFKKNTSMSELKVYTFDDARIDIKGQTTSMTTEWQHLNKVVENDEGFLVLLFNKRGMMFLAKAGFTGADDMDRFRALIRAKKIKNNFKS
jgi:Ca2+/Na+ antiporter